MVTTVITAVRIALKVTENLTGILIEIFIHRTVAYPWGFAGFP